MSKQTELDLNTSVPTTTDQRTTYLFEPIKGFPMLNWKGKRPFKSTQFYPAQLKETHGEEIKNWINKIYWGDNLQVMSHLLKEYRGKVKLVYIDPPFDSKADYKKKIKLQGKQVFNDQNAFEEKQYTDIWTNDDYLQFMYERLILIRELLADDGSIYLHCDWHKNHYIRCILDEIYGIDNCLNEIIWCYKEREMSKQHYNRKHDNILFYVKNKNANYRFNCYSITEPYSPITIKKFKYKDKDGRAYRLRGKDGTNDPSEENEDTYRQYLDEQQGTLPRDWFTLPILNQAANERLNYPTQKPEALLERIIKASSNKDDIVFDCFMGSGTTQAVAMKLGRRFIGADINLGAIQTTTKRLLNVAKKLSAKSNIKNLHNQQTELALAAEPQINYGLKNVSKKEEENIYYTGFNVYNVNNYDVFRNPVQAKDLLIEALEIQAFTNHSIYDGEKDGQMVKIMPINRIATKADLTPLISGLDLKSFDKRQAQNPNKVVEDILLVCMGHEPDLAPYLIKEMQSLGYQIKVEVVDILRDKSDIVFKREAEAAIKVKDDTLVIEQFFPLNLLKKLSLDKQNVSDWRELTESVMIDFNYDGSVFEPVLVDIPDKKEWVKGSYPIPKDAGTIRVKITDLLSESLEQNVYYG